MLAYAHINLLSMLSRFTPDEAIRVATDSIYVRKPALKRLEGVEAFIPMKKMRLRSRFAREECLPAVAPAQWRDKDEELYMPVEHAAYLAKPDYKVAKKDLTPSTAPGHDDPLSRHRLSYLSDRALPPERSPRFHPYPSPSQRDAGQGRPGPDLPQLFSMEWPNGVDT